MMLRCTDVIAPLPPASLAHAFGVCSVVWVVCLPAAALLAACTTNEATASSLSHVVIVGSLPLPDCWLYSRCLLAQSILHSREGRWEYSAEHSPERERSERPPILDRSSLPSGRAGLVSNQPTDSRHRQTPAPGRSDGQSHRISSDTAPHSSIPQNSGSITRTVAASHYSPLTKREPSPPSPSSHFDVTAKPPERLGPRLRSTSWRDFTLPLPPGICHDCDADE